MHRPHRRTAAFFLAALAALLLGGCAALDPYDNQVYCRATDQPGRCMDVIEAYRQAVIDGYKRHPTEEPDPAPPAADAAVPAPNPQFNPTDPTAPTLPAAAGTLSPREAYLRARDARLAELLEDPVTPVLAPPKLLRVLILPYTTRQNGVEELHMARYTYIKVEESRFVLDVRPNERPQADAPLFRQAAAERPQ